MKVLAGVRVLLVGQNDDYWDGLCSLLREDCSLKLVGRAHSAAEALERAHQLDPDLVLMDVSLPDGSGFEMAWQLKSFPKPPRVLLLTFHMSHAAEAQALAAGADGCLAKSEIPHRLLISIATLLERSQGQMLAKGTNP